MRSDVEKILKYTFKDKELLERGVMHPSVVGKKKYYHFERLEFLGDRVLALIVSNMLYHHFLKETEGDLAQRQAFLVSRDMCNIIACKIGLDEHVQYRKSDAQSTNSSIIANAFEAILGAMYLDGGIAPCTKFIEPLWEKYLTALPPKDPKTMLQEFTIQKGWGLPEYVILERTGPDHSPTFTIQVKAGSCVKKGVGPSRKMAEHDAASKVLLFIKKPKKSQKV